MALRPAGYRFLPGHRIRVSVASSAWPVDLAVAVRGRHSSSTAAPATPSRLILPVIPPAGGPGDVPVPAFKTDAPGRARGRRRGRRRRAGLADHGRRHRRDRHGHGPRRRRGRPRRRPAAVRRRDADDDRVRRRSGARHPRRRRRLPLAEHDFETEIRARSIQTSDADAFHLDRRPRGRRRRRAVLPARPGTRSIERRLV